MIKDNLLDKKSICHALIYSPSAPDVIIPIKGLIEDIHFEEDIPIYSIKLIKFYDSINFLKENFYDKPFLLKYKNKPKVFFLPKKKSVAELENWMIDEFSHRFCVESSFVVKTKLEMIDLFNKIEEYIIVKNFRAIRESSLRGLYQGPIKIQSKKEFGERFKRMYGDKFNLGSIDEYINFI